MSIAITDPAENWTIHNKSQDMSQNIIQLFPIIKNIHKQFPTDIIHADLMRMELLFEDGKINKTRINPENPFWSPENPFPINSIANDDEILSIWDRVPPGSGKLIFTQKKTDVQQLIKLKNENSPGTILIVGTFCKTMKAKRKILVSEVCTCYMIEMKPPAFYLTTIAQTNL
jgi:hypothetical protein